MTSSNKNDNDTANTNGSGSGSGSAATIPDRASNLAWFTWTSSFDTVLAAIVLL